MISLSTLKNSTRLKHRRRRVGRGPGSGLGKTCGRGEKGAGARSGYKRRLGYEGGQFRTFMKMPERGFSNVRFRRALDVVNLHQIHMMFEDGEVVDLDSLAERGFISGPSHGLKVLGDGELTKKVTIHALAFSKSAKEKLAQAKIVFKHIDRNGAFVEESKE